MENTLGLAKFLQKLFWGLLFSLIVIFLIIKVNQIEIININAFVKSLSILIQGISLFILIVLLAIIGLKTQDLIIQIVYHISLIINRIRFLNRILKKLNLESVLKSEAQLSKEIFINFLDDILRFLYLKSWAQPEVLGTVKELDLHCSNIKNHIINLKDDELIVQFDHYSSVTQEKAVKEQIRNNIREQSYILINTTLIFTLFISFFPISLLIIIFVFLYFLIFFIIMNNILKGTSKNCFFLNPLFIEIFF